ncbi:MAG: hypothetical protein AB1671_03660 [Thermodesulfobacteriota bacterium]|jgi:hypothetical protein
MDFTNRDSRVLVLAPTGRDARLICAALDRSGMVPEVCATVEEVGRALQDGAGAALVAVEALSAARIQFLVDVLGRQPAWSPFPFIVLTGSGASTGASLQQLALIERLKNVTLLERPLRQVTLVSAVRAALLFRQRQYEVRAHLAERLRVEEELRRSNEDL